MEASELYLDPGTRVAIDNLEYTVINGEDPQHVEVKSEENGVVYWINLLNKLESGNFVSTLDGKDGNGLSKRGILSLSERRLSARSSSLQHGPPLRESIGQDSP